MSKGKDPAFLFYSGDFLLGVQNLNMDERGKYITLLCIQHQSGVLSEKTIQLSVGSISDDLRKKFAVDDAKNLYNTRLFEEASKRSNFTRSRRDNAKKGKEHMLEQVPQHMPVHMVNVNEDVNKIVIENPKNVELTFPFNSPKFMEMWNILTSEPKWRKKTISALQSNLNTLGSITEDNAVKSMLDTLNNGWQGVFVDKYVSNVKITPETSKFTKLTTAHKDAKKRLNDTFTNNENNK